MSLQTKHVDSAAMLSNHDSMETFFPTFFSTGSLLAAIFSLYLGQLFFRIPDRSPASFHFAMISFFMVILHGTYTLASTFFHPIMAWHKVFAVGAGMLGGIHAAQMILHFPQKMDNFFSRTMPRIQYGIAILLIALFAVAAWNSDKRFIFDGHSWDFNAGAIYQITSIVILLFFVIGYIVGYIKAFRSTGNLRIILIILTTSYMLFTFVPGILNMLSRYGLVNRETYLVNTVIMNLAGFFFVSLIFINNLREKSSLLDKIVSISMLTVLVIIQAFSYFWLKEQDISFSRIYAMKSLTGDAAASVCRYTGVLSCSGAANIKPESILHKSIERDMAAIELLQTLAQNTTPEPRMLRADTLAGIAAKEFLLTDTPLQAHAKIVGINSKLFALREKAYSLKNSGNTEKLLRIFQSSAFPPVLRDALRSSLSKQKNYSTLWQEAVLLLSPIPSPEERTFRGDTFLSPHNQGTTTELFVAFRNQKDGVWKETLFPYSEYRTYMARSAGLLVALILIVTVILIFSFRFFFLGALIRPLERVISGVKSVNDGLLTTRLKVHVEDEIGFLAHSFNSMTKTIQSARQELVEYAETLEDKVKERTKELNDTLSNVEKLKSQQDGDYFLTTLLLTPLSLNRVQSQQNSVSFFMKQKKHFTFQKWKRDIGGDFCSAVSIYLNEREYHVIVNADAMGKSMQGAGGALVFGSVLHSIIERTHLSPDVQKQTPERWIKNTFVELHRVFASFDGSMLVSLLLSLLDNETGILYFINAEHPRSILLRDGKASFIEDTEIVFRKLGTPDANSHLSISVFPMQQGDIILFGSDGRDDVRFEDETGNHINEDDDRILRVVEKAGGNTEAIYELLVSNAELIDDISLVRIHRIAPSPLEKNLLTSKNAELLSEAAILRRSHKPEEAIKLLNAMSHHFTEAEESELRRELIRSLLLLHRYTDLLPLAKQNFLANPSDSELLYILSYASKKTGDLEEAAHYGERLRLRDPDHVKNLLNLSEIHLKRKNYIRSGDLLEEAREINPTARQIEKLEKALKKLGVNRE